MHIHGRTVVRAVAGVAVLFGIATVVAGARALLGAGPAYVVYLPLLRFNTIMGVAYVAAGVMAWRSARSGAYAAAAISVLNLVALGFISYLYAPNGAIARESLQAMTFRTIVWLALFLVLALASRARVSRQ